MLNTPSGKEPPKYFVSPDGNIWEEVPRVERRESATSFLISRACRAAGTVVVRLEGCAVSGFALAT